MQYIIPKEIIEDYFSEYKSQMIWILIAFTIISGLIQYFQNLRLSKKIEEYKNELKRDEIKFSRFNELQIESLKNLYDHIVTFHFKYTGLLKPTFYTHNSLKANLKEVKIEFWVCLEYFHRNRIFLTDEMVTTIRALHDNFKIVEIHLGNEWRELSRIEERNSSSNPQEIYHSDEDEVELIKKRIASLKSKDKVLAFEKDIKSIKENTENYFKQLTK